ncbi:hypothetical protein [Microbacterium sp. SA39]|uniref:hypothetical protein n=1 Tax=Microbacterium sp. SA39 TaxID=1263625 RepID=UPI00126A7265|nr:hypothetical protein [Microbacterium sp. SA39]
MTFEPPALSSPFRVLPLGKLDTYENGAAVVTVGAFPGDAPVGVSLVPEFRDFYEALNPSVVVPEAHGGSAQLLKDFAGEGLVKLLPAHPGLQDLDVVVTCVAPVTVKQVGSGSYVLDADGREFEVSELAFRMLPLLDGQRTLEEVAVDVRATVLADRAQRAAMEDIERDSGQSFDEMLAEEALLLIRELFDVGVGHFERQA